MSPHGSRSPSSEAVSSSLNELKLWLRGLVSRPDFFNQQPQHPLAMLRQALYLAITEIGTCLDLELVSVIELAANDRHSISVTEEDFVRDRQLDVNELHVVGLDGIHELERNDVVLLLHVARDELAWTANEIRRLEVHCQNARELKKQGLRKNFQYQPQPRKVLNLVRVGEMQLSSKTMTLLGLGNTESSKEEEIDANGVDSGGASEDQKRPDSAIGGPCLEEVQQQSPDQETKKEGTSPEADAVPGEGLWKTVAWWWEKYLDWKEG